ncbi:MAG: hypothetical protein D6690_08245 [Nitrospirae bacterium]|nr:MAG: hypothetical protein D6690_08245 [Nitrospirota bacterium]
MKIWFAVKFFNRDRPINIDKPDKTVLDGFIRMKERAKFNYILIGEYVTCVENREFEKYPKDI